LTSYSKSSLKTINTVIFQVGFYYLLLVISALLELLVPATASIAVATAAAAAIAS